MKNLLIIGPFPPLFSYGGPTKSITSLHNIFSNSNINHHILSPDHHLDRSKIIQEKKTNIFYRRHQSIFLISNFYKYDIIWLNSFFDIKLLILITIRLFSKFEIIVSPRGQLSPDAIITSNKFLKQIFIKIIRFFRVKLLFHSTSDSETDDIKTLFKKIKYKQISNLFNLDYKSNSVTKRKFIFYSRIHKKKGLHILLNTIQKYNLKIELDIYGFIEDEDYWKICANYIKKQSGIKYMGSLKDGDITKLANKYTFFILPTLNENFGHVIIELLSIGCIPIISKNTNPFDKDLSSIFNLNFEILDKADLKNVLEKANNMSTDSLIELKSKVKPYFDKINKKQEMLKNDYIYFINEINLN
jgi:glycosyltransferase involved in cell wall biosynthesis